MVSFLLSLSTLHSTGISLIETKSSCKNCTNDGKKQRRKFLYPFKKKKVDISKSVDFCLFVKNWNHFNALSKNLNNSKRITCNTLLCRWKLRKVWGFWSKQMENFMLLTYKLQHSFLSSRMLDVRLDTSTDH